MRFLKTSTLFLALALLVACAKAQSDYEEYEEMEWPTVLSLDPTITIEGWEYLSPEQLSQSDNPLVLPNSEGIVVGNERYRASMLWTKQGFDLYWGELPCATKPILLIKESAVIELFAGKQPPPPRECEAMESFHSFTVTLLSDIPISPANEWAYIFHPSEPSQE
jgi:hypothetical protein